MSCTYVRTYVCMLHDVRISCALHCLVHGVSLMEFETQLNAMHICILIGMSTVYTYIHVYVYMYSTCVDSGQVMTVCTLALKLNFH